MDHSDKYCDMCYKARELELENPSRAKVYMMKVKDKFLKSDSKSYTDDSFWTPSEKQFQEILNDIPETDYYLFVKSPYCIELQEIVFNCFKSFEQYWIAYYMKLKHNKYWIDEHWIELK